MDRLLIKLQTSKTGVRRLRDIVLVPTTKPNALSASASNAPPGSVQSRDACAEDSKSHGTV
jgi:hypothetical protein